MRHMSISIKCECGATYNLKDELAGQVVQCPKCAKNISVTKSIFDYDKLLVNQKHFSLSEKYFVFDEQKNKIFTVVRGVHRLKSLVAVISAAVVLFASIAIGVVAATSENSIGIFIGIMLFIGGSIASFMTLLKLAPFRHTYFYQGESTNVPVLSILQDSKMQFITTTYTLVDAQKQFIAKFKKNVFSNIFRKRWDVVTSSGAPVLVAKEDSIVLALLRRFIGPLFGLLRTNFIFVDPKNDQILGEFNRKLTLFDKYVLDMSADKDKKVDRRVALAMGVMLDTGEYR